MIKLDGWKLARAVFLLCAGTAIISPAQVLTTLKSFDGANGAGPDYMTLVQGVDAAFYGTTVYGGSGNACSQSVCGTVFKITTGGTLETFGLVPADGSEPVAGLMLATNGNFYGTAYQGGANGNGSIFEITRAGDLAVLYSFCAQQNCADGSAPQSRLVQATDGNFYGTTIQGGSNGQGTVFRISPSGALTTLHSFNGDDGSSPIAGLVQATDGNFYGTTSTAGGGTGTVFRITPGGMLTTLHTFGLSDGKLSTAALVQATDGSLYGTASEGGANDYGTVFKITLRGKLTTLYNFCSQPGCTDGGYPTAGLVQATDGNFYGTTFRGGDNLEGTVFKITAGGSLTTLHSFDATDGAQPFGGLVQGTNGNFYGTTSYGGNLTCNFPFGCGTVFSLDMGLGQFVTFVRAAGRVGHTGPILGQGFTGTTSVSFNGTQAGFTIVSDTYIRATVPTVATTGYVTVTTPSGTLTSNVPFRVIP